MSENALAYIESKTDDQRGIMSRIIEVVSGALPHLELRKSYGIPYFYYRNKPLCYLNIPSGSTHVALGINGGAVLADMYDVLTGDGTIIRHLMYETPNQIAPELIRAIVQDAALLIDNKLSK